MERAEQAAFDRFVEAFEAAGALVVTAWDVPVLEAETEALRRAKPDQPLIVLCVTDDDAPLEAVAGLPDVHVFRTSLRATRKAPNEHLLPYVFSETPRLEPLPRFRRPRISFCGCYRTHPLRTQSLVALMTDTRVALHAVLHPWHWAGKPHDPDVRRAFMQNMAEAEFCLCTRGRGNFSVRFYETLSAGRIPVLVDDDTPLPFADVIEWHELCVISRGVGALADDIVRFWQTRDVEAVQRRCAEVHDTYFEVGAAARRLVETVLGTPQGPGQGPVPSASNVGNLFSVGIGARDEHDVHQ